MSTTIQHITSKDLAKRWRVSLRTVERLRIENKIPYIKFGKGAVRFPLQFIETYEARNSYGPITYNIWGLEWRR